MKKGQQHTKIDYKLIHVVIRIGSIHLHNRPTRTKRCMNACIEPIQAIFISGLSITSNTITSNLQDIVFVNTNINSREWNTDIAMFHKDMTIDRNRRWTTSFSRSINDINGAVDSIQSRDEQAAPNNVQSVDNMRRDGRIDVEGENSLQMSTQVHISRTTKTWK